MEGTVTNIVATEEGIHFRLAGWFWFTQYPWGGTNQQVIKVDCKRGIPATVHQADPFFAFTPDWRAGSLGEKGRLLRILKIAEVRGRVVKFELTQPKVGFGPDGSLTLMDATVIRATDADLR
jgi:hypothetical protein